jgi:hypothetical protein
LADDRETSAAYGFRAKRTVVQTHALDKHVWAAAGLPQASDLGPKPTSQQRVMQVADCLSLDEYASAEVIVPRRDSSDVHRCSERLELPHDATSAFENVCDDAALRCPDEGL